MFRISLGFAVIALTLVIATPSVAQQKRVSPHETINSKVGGGLVTITYGRPYTKSPKDGSMRKVWGGLVPYGKAWRAGADEATSLLAQQDIMIGDKLVPAGAYTLYLVPTETGGKLAISKTVGKWGIPVDEKNDFARVDVKKEALPTGLDQFTIALEKSGKGAVLKMMWENAAYTVELSGKK